MPVTPAGVATGFGLVLDIVDFIFGRTEAADTTRRLEEIDAKLDDIDGRIDHIGAQITNLILDEQIGAVRNVRDALANFPPGQTDSAQVREALRQEIIANSSTALTTLIEQAGTLISPGASYTELAVAVNALDLALMTRLRVAAELEFGPMGNVGLRDRVNEVAQLQFGAVTALNALTRDSMQPFIEIERVPSNLPFEITLPLAEGERDGTVRIGAESADYGNLSTERLSINYYELAALGGAPVFTPFPLPVPPWWEVPRLDDAYELRYERVLASTRNEAGVSELRDQAQGYLNAARGQDILGTAIGELLEGADDAGEFANDLIVGGGGDDTIEGGRGADALRGDDGDDRLFGGAEADFLTGGAGDDLIFGGAGYDVARYFGLQKDYVVTGRNADATVTGPDGTDTLRNVETILFDDGEISFTEGGQIAGEQVVAFLYGCLFDRDPDLPGLNFWIGFYRDGMSVFEIASYMTSEDGGEFEQLYGPIDSLPTEDFVRLLYRNTLDRETEGDGFAFWTQAIDEGLPRSQVVFFFSESEEYRANNDDLISTLVQSDSGDWVFG